MDGTCTSARKILAGSVGLPQFSYDKGHSSKVPTGSDLPSARFISNLLCSQPGSMPNRRGLNELVTFMGQFLDHSIITTPVQDGDQMDIPIPPTDAIFANFSSGKLSFTRAVRASVPRFPGSERAINALTSAIDLAAVYGSSEDHLRGLRSFTDGMLLTSAGNLLPLNTKGLDNAPKNDPRYFVAGDHRSNENPVLTSIHTIFLREHNKLAQEIKQKMPWLDDETLFQYAKLWNTAQFQKIIFEEFYPMMTGRDMPPYKGFKGGANPIVSDIFGGAAFRVGHTLVGQGIHRRGPGFTKLETKPAREMFFQTATVLNEGVENFLRGAVFERAQEVDVFVVDALRNMLFQHVQGEDGFDLVALNIQRGRDLALPKYNEIRGMFNRPRATSFADITRNLAVQNALHTAYGSVDKVEAWIGLMAEDHAPGASMGKTMLRIWRREFVRLRNGDRFYYERKGMYPKELLQSFKRLRKMLNRRQATFKRVILRNSDIQRGELKGSLWLSRA